ncbi:O-antigen ligase family protein [Granulicatella sp. 19428wC4_WM01]|uniref:O-antigen ligase family protein n=2 Tax=unclassified Granulicatella TaxID=2630493 RepID=UPI0010735087|nr:O-antigen ligase family protein [Granulicatella sp. WM01]MBF0780533.1 O-antigen ligase family protein [Granulicatella sp. 19428wC4_WM01]
MMFPFPIACLLFFIATILLLFQKSFRELVKQSLPHKLLGAFFSVSSIASLLAQNYLGAAITLALMIFAIYFTYYVNYVSKKTFECLLDILLTCSFFHAIYASLEAWFILPPVDYNALHPMLVTWRDGRADSFFFNPNYYALFCAFTVLIAGYKIYYASSLKQYVWYGVVALFNGFGMLFTLTRTILPSLLIALLAFVIFIRSRRLKRLIGLITIIIIVVAILFYRHIPRFDLEAIDEHIDIRLDIWVSSFTEFFNAPLIGQGPLTYMTIYEKYNSYPTQHAHNLLLDTLLNYGIIGFVLISRLCYDLILPLKSIKNSYQLKALYSLGMSFIVLVVVHGIMDVTIFWVQTLFVFLLVILAIPNLQREDTSIHDLNN